MRILISYSLHQTWYFYCKIWGIKTYSYSYDRFTIDENFLENTRYIIIKGILVYCEIEVCYETDVMWLEGDPIWVRTLSSHCRGPSRWISIQHGVDVTSCRWYSAPHPLTNDILSTEKIYRYCILNFQYDFAIFYILFFIVYMILIC